MVMSLVLPGEKGLQIVVYGPYSAGQSRQRAPIRNICTMPEITRRPSTRRAPQRPLGSNGSIRAHSASLNQVSALPIGDPTSADILNQHITSSASLIEYGP